jgi:hypothetical protein
MTDDLVNTTIDELTSELEKAEGPSRWLDGLIAVEIGFMVPHFDIDPSSAKFRYWDQCGGHWVPVNRAKYGADWRKCGCQTDDHFCEPFAYTRSIDAALTLVPENGSWTVSGWQGVDGKHHARARLDDHEDQLETRMVATPAIAICIAAMKARKQ